MGGAQLSGGHMPVVGILIFLGRSFADVLPSFYDCVQGMHLTLALHMVSRHKCPCFSEMTLCCNAQVRQAFLDGWPPASGVAGTWLSSYRSNILLRTVAGSACLPLPSSWFYTRPYAFLQRFCNAFLHNHDFALFLLEDADPKTNGELIVQ